MQLKPHQIPLTEKLLADLAEKGRALAAHFTGAGKTAQAIYIMKHLGGRWLVQAHGQREIRGNFFDQIKKLAPELGAVQLEDGWYKTEAGRKAAREANIIIAIPQTIWKHLDILGPVKGIVVDEAHQFFLHDEEEKDGKKMSRAINTWAESQKALTLVLTASHFRIRWEEKSFFSGEEGLAAGVCDDVTIKTVAVPTALSLEDYTESQQLKKEAPKVKLRSRAKLIAESIKHTPAIVVTSSIEDAEATEAALRRRKLRVRRSESENDPGADVLKEFKAGEFDVCVVVNRAQIGFDFDKLMTVVDASFSHNIERLQQAVGRLMRRHDDRELAKHKLYVKLCPEEILPVSEVYCSTILGLQEATNFREFDGADASKLKLLNRRARKEGTTPYEGSVSSLGVPKKPGKPKKPVRALEERFSNYIQHLKENWNDGEAVTTLERALIEARKELGVIVRDPGGNKAEILRIIKETGKVIPRDHPLNKVYRSYTSPSSTSYDAVFTSEVDSLITRCKVLTVEEKIKRTLDWWYGGQVGRLPAYVNKSNDSYCQEARDALIAAGYDPKEAKRKGAINSGKMSGPKNGAKRAESIRKSIQDHNGTIYPSIKGAARQLKLKVSSICKVLKGKYSQTGGYRFQYVDEQETIPSPEKGE